MTLETVEAQAGALQRMKEDLLQQKEDQSLLGRWFGNQRNLDREIANVEKALAEAEADLAAERDRPASEERQRKRGEQLQARVGKIVAELDALKKREEELLGEAETLAREISRDGIPLVNGHLQLAPPFHGGCDLGKLRFWAREERGTFRQKLERWRAIR